MSDGIAIDVSQFQAALKEYIRYSSKTAVQAVNGKARDLALRSAQNTPKSKLTPAEFRKQQTDPELITFVARQIFEKRGGMRGGKYFSEIRRATEATMAKKRFAKGYMRSGYTKAALKFKPTEASTMRVAKLDGEHARTTAQVKSATESNIAALFDVAWGAKGDKDGKQKQAIVSPAIAKAVSFVTADMQRYIARKLEQQAKRNSAQAAKAVVGFFR